VTTAARYVKCTGTLNAESYDKFGVPSELLVKDSRGREYRIAKDEIWDELADYVGEEVWVGGTVSEDDAERAMITVDKYRVFAPEDDEDVEELI